MKHSQKAKYIISTCMLAVGVFSAFILYKSFRPSRGLPYEEATMEQAAQYMTFESGYLLLDISDPESFAGGHIEGALNIPYEHLLDRIATEVQDKTRTIYLCGNDPKVLAKAARKLSEMGYTGVTLIGSVEDWPGELERQT